MSWFEAVLSVIEALLKAALDECLDEFCGQSTLYGPEVTCEEDKVIRHTILDNAVVHPSASSR